MKKLILGFLVLSSFSLHAYEYDCEGILQAKTSNGQVSRVPFAILDYKIDDPDSRVIMLRQNGINEKTSLTEGEEQGIYNFNFDLGQNQKLVGTLKITPLDSSLSTVVLKAEAIVEEEKVGTFVGAYSCSDIKL